MKKKHQLPVVLGLLTAMSVSLAILVSAVSAEDQGQKATVADGTEEQVTMDQNKYEVKPDTWVFTDSLGRTSLTNADVGDPKDDKTLAMFYWTWHTSDNGMRATPLNLTEFMEQYPDAQNDYDHPIWSTLGSIRTYWNEPLFGYYRGNDTWVLRKHAEMLADAGVDVIFTDNTNGTYTWKETYDALFEVWTDAQNDGVKTPKVSFMLPFGPNENSNTQIEMLYDDIYSQNKYQNLWFYWDNKPMLMAWGNALDMTVAKERTMYQFFTFRNNYAGYRHNETLSNLKEWGWLSAYPQMTYYGDRGNMVNNVIEQVTAGVAINHSYVTDSIMAMNGTNVMGRSYTTAVGRGEIPYPTDPTAKLYGYQFAEQFEYALEQNSKVIFVTGWNEWTAGRHSEWAGVENAFPDQFTDEYSRDIEPSRGDLGDCYYYQLVNYVRQYKGVRAIPEAGAAATIDIQGDVSQWDAVAPFYAAYQGNTEDRDSAGCGTIRYTDYSGRNDIIGAQVARDDDMVYFMVECAEDITPYTDPLWMVLYIDCDQNNQGWETFDYVINKTSPSATHAAVEKFVDGYESEIVGTVKYTVNGRYMQVAVPKSMLGLEGYDFTINFAWTDNVHDWDDHGNVSDADGTLVYNTFSGDILDFYTSGDVAPGMRFKYSYVSTTSNAFPKTETETESVEETTAAEATETETVAATQSAGCKSAVAGVLPIVSAVALAGACVRKRRKNRA